VETNRGLRVALAIATLVVGILMLIFSIMAFHENISHPWTSIYQKAGFAFIRGVLAIVQIIIAVLLFRNNNIKAKTITIIVFAILILSAGVVMNSFYSCSGCGGIVYPEDYREIHFDLARALLDPAFIVNSCICLAVVVLASIILVKQRKRVRVADKT
jgi:lysylphosphatidylglycerol synthetase-like protein (DUF2156 family)